MRTMLVGALFATALSAPALGLGPAELDAGSLVHPVLRCLSGESSRQCYCRGGRSRVHYGDPVRQRRKVADDIRYCAGVRPRSRAR